MTFTLPNLPFDEKAFAPNISAETFALHHGKHHKGYVDKANELTKGTEYENMSLEDAVIESRRKGVNPISNNIAQIYNHNIFWKSITPTNGGGLPPKTLAKKIDDVFGSYEEFKKEFINTSNSMFGSGWVWLVAECGNLEIIKTQNAETPIICGKTPLFVCDLWEHAYYVDYQNRRADFINTFIEKLVNWEFALDQYAKDAEKKGLCHTPTHLR